MLNTDAEFLPCCTDTQFFAKRILCICRVFVTLGGLFLSACATEVLSDFKLGGLLMKC